MTDGRESAFPEVREQPQFNYHTYGLTKREYFAAMALQGMIAKYGTDYQSGQAKECVYMADELINALNQSK